MASGSTVPVTTDHKLMDCQHHNGVVAPTRRDTGGSGRGRGEFYGVVSLFF